MSDIVETKKSNSKIELSKSEENNSKKNVNENQENNLHKDISGLQDNNIPKKEDNVLTDSDNHIKENKTDVNFEIKDELTDDELINNNEPSNPRNTNSPVTPASRRTSTYYRRASIARAIKFQKEKEIFIQKGKNKLQEKPEKNKIRYLTEEEIDLAFQWFTNGKSVISPEDVKNCFDTFFTGVSKNDKKYYVDGGIKQDTRHLINTREEKIQSEMFNSTQTISSLKKMLLKYPFKMKDYDNAFSILCGGDLEESISNKTLNKYIEILKDNDVPIKNNIDKILRCFDKDKDGELGISDLYKMKLFDLKKITDDF